MRQGAYAIRYREALPYMVVDSAGWQTADSERYGNEGMRRSDHGHVMFQYTLAGEGRLANGTSVHRLPPGTGFLAVIPSEHRYYYEDDGGGKPWEFLWVNAKGEDALRLWERAIQRGGPIVRLPVDSPAIERLWDICRAMARGGSSAEPAALSTLLYRMMLALLEPAAPAPEMPPDVSGAAETAKGYIKKRWNEPVTLEEVARHCGVSVSYVCRAFRKQEGMPPLEYQRRRRIEAAVTMLRGTDLPVADVGRSCGFDSPSYFGKTFRRYVGASPQEYRNRKLEYPFDRLTLK